jgi:hypothetical protein
MKSTFKTTSMKFPARAVLAIFIFGLAMGVGGEPVIDARLQSLRDMLDSLEVAMQAQNRTGVHPDDLDAAIATCRDSIALYRHLVENSKKSANHDASRAGTDKISLLSIIDVRAGISDLAGLLGISRLTSHPFMIFFSGPTLAVLSLLGLCLVALSFTKTRKRRVGRQAGARRAVTFYQAARENRSMFPPPLEPGSEEPLELLSPDQVHELHPAAAFTDDEDSNENPAASIPPIEALVVSAGEEGLSAREISRRYHVSADSVGLAMALAKKR